MLMIRKMRASDVEQIAALEKEIFPDPWSVDSIQETLAQKQALKLVAYEDKKLIGYLFLYYVLEEGEIARIAVCSEYRRKGVGERMLIELQTLCEDNGITRMMLEVRESNEAAISFYIGHGFKTDGVRKKFYKDPAEDGILMSRGIGS